MVDQRRQSRRVGCVWSELVLVAILGSVIGKLGKRVCMTDIAREE